MRRHWEKTSYAVYFIPSKNAAQYTSQPLLGREHDGNFPSLMQQLESCFPGLQKIENITFLL